MYVWETGSIEVLFEEGSAWNIFCVLEDKLLKHAVKQSRNVSLLYHSWIHQGLLFWSGYFYRGMWDAAAPVPLHSQAVTNHAHRCSVWVAVRCLWVKLELLSCTFRLNGVLWGLQISESVHLNFCNCNQATSSKMDEAVLHLFKIWGDLNK